MLSINPSDLLILAKYEVRRKASRAVRRALKKPVVHPLPSRISRGRQKRLIIKNGFSIAGGGPSWFYSALDRGQADPLTNFSLQYITENVPKDAQILVTGCGTGITAFYLADAGFAQIHGIDLLPECIQIADEIKREGRYTGVSFSVDDGLRPSLTQSYDLITALHWVFSAWMGNYGNDPAAAGSAREPESREALLSQLLAQYAPHLRSGGELLIELTDAVADYRLAEDHFMSSRSQDIYPVRHTPEQVGQCAATAGLQLVDKKLCVSFGHHPRTLYILRKP